MFLIPPGLAVLFSAGCAAPKVKDADMSVARLAGAARYRQSEGGPWSDVQRGITLRPGVTVQTADKSRMDLRIIPLEIQPESARHPSGPPAGAMAKQDRMEELNWPIDWRHLTTNDFRRLKSPTVIRVWENTTVEIEKSCRLRSQFGDSVREEAEFKVQKGHIFFLVRQTSDESSFEIRIPNAKARFGVGVYDLTAEGLARVLVGRMVLTYTGPDGAMKTAEVPAGMEFDARTEQMHSLSDPVRDDVIYSAPSPRAD